MTKVVFRESLVMQKMRGSGCDGGRCLSTHLQADFAPVSENEVRKTPGIARARSTRTHHTRHEISRGFVRFQGKNANGDPIPW